MADRPTCATCWWWQAPGPLNAGQCRRYAPRPRPAPTTADEVVGRDHPRRLNVWPLTFASDWCGEWAPPPVGNEPKEGS